ncbi:putative zinc-type alcohol dehydrogenase-like protein [Escovopsis weberi]|uniref:Putative zinc-type alcohol dehydrogenase-like protein n=1 Tax=Escovopsis weberi TaxID=150374 RepID=A0A0N0RSW5_ESCWE|nr:putative zinc-type alcohol dehydrogenase-like protein [Escovopsis weberi]
MSLPNTMKAVVFDGPRKVSIQDRPVPQLQDDTDVLVKVTAAALCGSELHVYRGHQASETGFVMGHEFVGTVVAAGRAVKNLSVGDKIVAPFTVSCGECFYCRRGFSSRCASSRLFGSPALDGGQAEFVRIPLADGTLFHAPPVSSISDSALILMADIFPTGYYAAKSALELEPPQPPSNPPASSSPSSSSSGAKDTEDAVSAAALLAPPAPPHRVVVVIGCGPVGLCALVAAAHVLSPRALFAVDSVPARLAQAAALGAEPLDFAGEGGVERVRARVAEASGGRGADVVIEVVGLAPALRTAFELVRPFGVISSIGVHNAEIPWTGNEAYGKNIRLQMGRCPVRSIFPEALRLLSQKQHLLGFMFDNIMPLSKAVEAYTLFDEMKVQKVIFKPHPI